MKGKMALNTRKNEDNHVLNRLGFGFLWGELRIFLKLGSLSRGPQKETKLNFSSTVFFSIFMLKNMLHVVLHILEYENFALKNISTNPACRVELLSAIVLALKTLWSKC
jgi:hypothetical protein